MTVRRWQLRSGALCALLRACLSAWLSVRLCVCLCMWCVGGGCGRVAVAVATGARLSLFAADHIAAAADANAADLTSPAITCTHPQRPARACTSD